MTTADPTMTSKSGTLLVPECAEKPPPAGNYTSEPPKTPQRDTEKEITVESIVSANDTPNPPWTRQPRDQTQALSTELLTKATVQVVLAAVCWLLPLSAISSPSALTAIPISLVSHETCPSVDGATTISLWDFLDGTHTPVYSQPSYDSMGLAAMTLPSNNGPPSPHNPCPGANCTSTTISFDGPACRCKDCEEGVVWV
ncbi:hypothetical protein B0T14DRAFT_571946 [Immersiella caudata]|uniref:Uncharacterized protein n=1 Tax=Immersiella caudata TaxID=314043 RepID=A0AA39WCY4_9PEZI|nr:hypothetical protein B0T14DRAFT_571946 [Immersiella caudata]